MAKNKNIKINYSIEVEQTDKDPSHIRWQLTIKREGHPIHIAEYGSKRTAYQEIVDFYNDVSKWMQE